MDQTEKFVREFAEEGVPIPPEVLEKVEETKTEPAEKPKPVWYDRDMRRKEKALQDSREMNIALNERLKVLSETTKFKEEVQTDEDIHRMLYGSAAETAETKASALAVQKVLEKQASIAEERAYTRALAALQERDQAITKEVEENASYLESELESIEEHFDVDLSGETEESKKIRNGFIDYVAKFSRKDAEGNIKEYPDIQATWEEYQSRRERPTSRNRQVASRSMTSSAGGDATTESEKKALEKYMLEKGYI